MNFIERLEFLIKENHTTKKAIAEYAGITPPSITDWKTEGTIPRADVAIKIAEFLHVSVEYLITGADPAKPDMFGVIQKAQDLLEELKKVSLEVK